MKKLKGLLAILAGCILAMVAANASADQWQTVYQTEFSSMWDTNNSTHYNLESETLHATSVDGANDYAYALVPGMGGGARALRLEYDIKPDSYDWSGNSRLGCTTRT